VVAVVADEVLLDTDDGESVIDHIACCRNDDLALCGEDLSGAECVVGPTGAPVCGPCEFLDEKYDGCPYGGRCPE
jgi:hypothetical protein